METDFPYLHPGFIEFRVTDQQRFQALLQVFEIIKQEKWKQNEDIYFKEEEEDDDIPDNYYEEHILQPLENTLFDLFDEQALAHFSWPSKQEIQEYTERWFATPVSERFTDPSLKETSWDFSSMIDSLMSGEYNLLFCKLLTSDTGALMFAPFSYPYGGTECMQALVEAFECKVIGVHNCVEYISYIEDDERS